MNCSKSDISKMVEEDLYTTVPSQKYRVWKLPTDRSTFVRLWDSSSEGPAHLRAEKTPTEGAGRGVWDSLFICISLSSKQLKSVSRQTNPSAHDFSYWGSQRRMRLSSLHLCQTLLNGPIFFSCSTPKCWGNQPGWVAETKEERLQS